LARTRVGDTELWLLKPMSYMNHSGDPLRSVASFYKLPIESVLVAYDEAGFPTRGGAPEAGRRRRTATTACAT